MPLTALFVRSLLNKASHTSCTQTYENGNQIITQIIILDDIVFFIEPIHLMVYRVEFNQLPKLLIGTNKMIFDSVWIFQTLETLWEQFSRITNALRVVASKKELERKREITGRLSRDLPLAKELSSKRANRALPCFFQRFYKCYRCLGRTGPTQAAGARGERGLASRVPDAVRATPRRAPSRPTSSTTAANRRVSSARTAASLARRSSTSRITLGTSTRRSRSSATRSSRTSRAAGYGASERQLPREHRFNACDPPPRGSIPHFPTPFSSPLTR